MLSQRFDQNGQVFIKMAIFEWIGFSQFDHLDLTLSQIDQYDLTLSQMNHIHLMTKLTC